MRLNVFDLLLNYLYQITHNENIYQFTLKYSIAGNDPKQILHGILTTILCSTRLVIAMLKDEKFDMNKILKYAIPNNWNFM